MKIMKYSVVIVTYNRLNLLKECLQCVDQQTLKVTEIVLINNCSTDGTAEFLEDYAKNHNYVNFITTEKNLGGSGGFELGIRSVSDNCDYVLLIDDDAMLDKDFFAEIEKNMENGVEAYSGTIRTDGKIDTSHRRRLKNPILMIKEDVSEIEYEQPFFYYQLASFCGLLVSKKIIDKIGFPKGEYFIWYDDTEYSMRISQLTKIKNINSARINHKTFISTDQSLSWKSYYGYRNQIDFGRRFSKFPALFCLFRYTYHRYRVIYYKNKYKKTNDTYYLECSKLNQVVIEDSKKGVLGISRVYYPGKKLK